MSTVTPAEVIAMYPEFGPAEVTDPGIIQTHIDKCENLVDRTVLGRNWTTAVIIRTAISLAKTQSGQDMRLSDRTDEAVLQGEYDRITLSAGSAYRV